VSVDGKSVASRLLWASGLSAVARMVLVSSGRFALEFHGVPARRDPRLGLQDRPVLVAADLERILGWLAKRFRFLSPDEFLSAGRTGVLLTFDDGFANNHDVVLPLLRQFGAPAVFFVATGHLGIPGRWLGFIEERAARAWGRLDAVPRDIGADLYDGLTEEQLRACAADSLVTLGAHSVSHPRLTALDEETAQSEIEQSKRVLEDISGKPISLFAYPFGDANDRVALIVKEAGYRAAFLEDPRPIGIRYLAIPRVGIHRTERWYLAAKLSGLHDRPLTEGLLSL
jgi:peptidoglycan/xylan/chitin deacetylase (PgdA/CDA1 family)